ncbi:FAD binding domain-containing protein [Aspergillus unguis]
MTLNSSGTKPVLVIGAGPVGMILSYALSRLSVPVILFDQAPAHQTTQYPKMDYTNSRSMELLRFLGLANEYRSLEGAVGPDTRFESMFTTSLGPNGKELGRWSVPSVTEQKEQSERLNDGTFPTEPGQRCSQIVFEKWLRDIVLNRCRDVSFHGGWKYIGHDESDYLVKARFVDMDRREHTVIGQYLVGCDGGRSAVRKNAGIRMIGTQLPARFHLVHFRSKHLASELDVQGQRFWHAFPTGSGFVIDQDGKDTFTAHYALSTPKEESKDLDPREIVSRVLGGRSSPWPIAIDEVLVHSRWQPSFAIADRYISDNRNVFLAGDAAHLIPPHGGYGFNSGIVDAVDLSWRLAAVVKRYGGDLLLEAYNFERRPMMMRALRRSHRHLMEHIKFGEMLSRKGNWDVLDDASEDGERVRNSLKRFLHTSGPDTTDWGVELDLRYDHSPCIWPDSGSPSAVPWTAKRYHPSTKPGHRAPHVFLRGGDGRTSVYDLLGSEWTLVHFVTEANDMKKAASLLLAAKQLHFPVKHLILQNEKHIRKIWERDLVLVRPDTHVAWRGNGGLTEEEARNVLAVVLGRKGYPGHDKNEQKKAEDVEERLFRETLAALGNAQDRKHTGMGDSKL